MIEISVVIPTFDRRCMLYRCIKSLTQQTLEPVLYEIIVADDENNPKTLQMVEDMQIIHLAHDILYLPIEGRHGPAAARNQGWKKARGRVIAFIDDDCIADSHWLAWGLAGFKQGIDAAWGKVVMPLREHPTDYELNASALSRAIFVTANCFCTKQVLKETGGFDERFRKAWREDSDLYFTLIEREKHIMYVPNAVVEHPVRPAGFGVCLKQQKNNLYEALLFKKHPFLYRQCISSQCMWYYYGACAAFVFWAYCLNHHWTLPQEISAVVWCAMFFIFVLKRLRHTSKDPLHIVEMAFTSFLIPPLSIIWRLAGAWRFRVPFI